MHFVQNVLLFIEVYKTNSEIAPNCKDVCVWNITPNVTTVHNFSNRRIQIGQISITLLSLSLYIIDELIYKIKFTIIWKCHGCVVYLYLLKVAFDGSTKQYLNHLREGLNKK